MKLTYKTGSGGSCCIRVKGASGQTGFKVLVIVALRVRFKCYETRKNQFDNVRILHHLLMLLQLLI